MSRQTVQFPGEGEYWPTSQSVQADFADTYSSPNSHAVQFRLPRPSANLPCGQSEQVPGEFPYFPTLHSVQAALGETYNSPNSHAVQFRLPVASVNWPTSQPKQTPALEPYFPTAQSEQMAEPEPEVFPISQCEQICPASALSLRKNPAAHSLQAALTSSEGFGMTSLNFPGTHFWHCAAPSFDV